MFSRKMHKKANKCGIHIKINKVQHFFNAAPLWGGEKFVFNSYSYSSYYVIAYYHCVLRHRSSHLII